jgi:hypothetical protein
VEPFSVTCETCRARLKVRDASVIGEIHACPKCESMVLITPPAGWRVASAVVAPAPALPAATGFAQVASPSEEAAEAFAEAAALTSRASPEPVSTSTGAEPTSAASLPPVGAPPLASVLAGSKLLVGSLIGAAILVMSGVALSMFLGGDSSQPVSPRPDTATASAFNSQATVEEENASIAATRGPEQSHDVSPPVEVVAAKPPSDAVEESTVDSPVANLQSSERVAAPPNQETSSEIAATSPVATEPNPPNELQAAIEPPAVDTRHAPVLKFDPLDFDPSQLSLGAFTASTNEPSRSIAAAQPEDVDARIPVEEAALDSDGVLPPPAESPSVSVRLGPLVADKAGPQSSARSLALRVDTFTADDIRLERFVALVSEMAGMPIALDPSAFELSGASPRTDLTVNVAGATLDELLRGTLSKHRLELVDDGGHLRIELAGRGERSARTHDVSDLLKPGAADARTVATLIERFVSPKTWHAAGGIGTIEIDGGKLRIDQTRAVQHEVVVFCERLRLASGLRQHTRYPADRLSIDSPYREIDSQLSVRTTFTFLPWTRLADVVHHWEQECGITMLVDWRALADVHLDPSSPISCSAVDREWGEALHEILEPIGLSWWAVDSETIQITTQDALADIERTEFHAVPKAFLERLSENESLVDSLQKELQEHVGVDTVTVESVQIPSDGMRLLVRGNAQVHRYVSGRFEDSAR